MALTLRTNGSGGANLVGAIWWNDYYNLLTGVMSDQPIIFNQSVSLKSQAAPSATMTATPVAGGSSMGVGLYNYAVVFVNTEAAQTALSTTVAATTTSGNKTVNLAVIPTGPAGTSSRSIYRSKVGGGQFYLLTTIPDNVTVAIVDSAADTSLTVLALVDPNLGGILLKDATGTVNGWLTGGVSGRAALDASTLTSFAVAGIEIMQLKSDGGTYFPSGIHLGQTSKGDFVDIVGNAVYIKAATSGNFQFQVPSGTTVASLDSTGYLAVDKIKLHNSNSMNSWNEFGGTGTGTYNHNLQTGLTPTWVGVTDHVSGSTSVGYDSENNANVHITVASGSAFKAWAYA